MKFTIQDCALLAALALSTACKSTGTFQGKLVDANTGAPRANERVIARATGGNDMTCQTRDATTGADGSFTLIETCADLTYALEAADRTLALDAPVSFQGGVPSAGSQDVKVWRAPRGDGVFVIADDKITEITKAADVYWEPVFPDPTKTDTYEKALYASSLPDPLIKVPAGGFLAISGSENLDTLKIHPLIAHAAGVQFPHPEKAEKGAMATVSGASWVGLTFRNDKVSSTADIEHMDAKIDASKVKELKGDTWATRIIPAEAMANGHYAILADGDSRMYLLAVGDGPVGVPGGLLQEGSATITPGGPGDLNKPGAMEKVLKGPKGKRAGK